MDIQEDKIEELQEKLEKEEKIREGCKLVPEEEYKEIILEN